MNEPAFPHLISQCQRANETEYHEGLSKRELFAAMAMQGILSGDSDDTYTVEKAAVVAVELADALIAELSKEPTP